MIECLKNLLSALCEYLKLKNKSFVFDKIDELESKKNDCIKRIENLRDSDSNHDECLLLRQRISSYNERIKYLSAFDSSSEGGDSSKNL